MDDGEVQEVEATNEVDDEVEQLERVEKLVEVNGPRTLNHKSKNSISY